MIIVLGGPDGPIDPFGHTDLKDLFRALGGGLHQCILEVLVCIGPGSAIIKPIGIIIDVYNPGFHWQGKSKKQNCNRYEERSHSFLHSSVLQRTRSRGPRDFKSPSKSDYIPEFYQIHL